MLPNTLSSIYISESSSYFIVVQRARVCCWVLAVGLHVCFSGPTDSCTQRLYSFAPKSTFPEGTARSRRAKDEAVYEKKQKKPPFALNSTVFVEQPSLYTT